MNSAKNKSLRMIVLGQLAEELSPLARRLAALQVEQCNCSNLDELPAPLAGREVLLTELAWLNGLAPAMREGLARRAAMAAGWIALTDANASFKEQVAWQRSGVSHFFQQPLDADRLIALIEDIRYRLDGPPVRVILVDDDASSLSHNGEILRQADIEVLAMEDPLLVLQAIEDFKPDLLLLEFEMPACRGPELATMVRQRPEYARLPVIFLTETISMQDMLLARQAAAEDFLTKPVAPELLVAAVKSHALRYRFELRARNFRRKREARARFRLDQLRAAVDEHAIVSIADVKGNIVYVNNKFCAISGYSRDELLGQNHRMIKSGKHPPEFYREMWRTIGAGLQWQGEVCNRRKNGEFYWVEATIVPILDDKGRPYQFVSIRTDITILRHREEELRISDERLRRAQVYANIGTWDWDIQTGELFWSERIATLFGHPTGEWKTSNDNFLAAIHPDDRQNVTEAINACLERDVPYDIEHRVIWPDGTERWLQERGAVVRDATGRPLHMLGVVQDIDHRKRAELALAESEKRLREAQTLARIGNWTADLITNELTWSDEIYRIFGHQPGSFAPSIEAFRAAVHPDDLRLLAESARRTAKTGIHDLVHRIVRPDGSVSHVHELGRSGRDAADTIVRLEGTLQDITEQVEAEQALIAARDEADRASRAKSEFISSMSHELRTPMNAILGFGQIMEFDDALPDEHQESVQEILKAGRHLLKLINEVLDLSKVESGRIHLSLEPVEIDPIVEECLSFIGNLANQRAIQISRCELKGTAVRADRTRLRQVLLNLLSNAVKYNHEGGSVRLEVRPAGADRLRILVTDTGPGIPAARLAELFQPFNRLEAENSGIEGTGIGLTITRRIVEMMGGTVDVESEVGVGSTFWIELLLESLPELDQESLVCVAPDSATPVKRNEAAWHTVLYVEDNPANLRLVAQILGRRQHIHLLTAHTPELGIELALAHRPELILLDINMPGMDGYQVLKLIQSTARLKSIPVVAVTANAMPSDIERGKAAGFTDYLTKPLDVGRFHAVIDRLLVPAENES